MKLPSLPDLDLDDNLDRFMDDNDKQIVTKKKKAEGNKKSNIKVENSSKKEGKKKPRIPKTEYDSEGNPILAIPDLNDVDLSNEIDRFFGGGGN